MLQEHRLINHRLTFQSRLAMGKKGARLHALLMSEKGTGKNAKQPDE